MNPLLKYIFQLDGTYQHEVWAESTADALEFYARLLRQAGVDLPPGDNLTQPSHRLQLFISELR